jgi:DNA invertase Pin-like site-specific DNA recombinase
MSNKELYCYLRVSTKSQEEEGHSIENQRYIGKKISKKLGLKYVEMNEGGLSSMSKSRKKFNEIKEGMRVGRVKNLWYYSRSRWTRDENKEGLIRKNYFQKYKINVYEGENGVKRRFNTSQDKFMDSIFTTVQEFDREQRREVSVGGKRHLSRTKGDTGVFMGGTINFGFKNVDKRFEIDEYESKYVKKMFQMYLQGISRKKIKIFLDTEGVKPRRSNTWNLQTILNMLNNRVYVGEFKWNSKEMDNKDVIEESFNIVVPQIISHSLFNRVHKKIKKNIKNYGNNLRKHDNLLGDLLVCSCGQNITGRTKKQNKKNTVLKMYGCRSRDVSFLGKEVKPCNNNRTMNMDNTDSLIVNRIKEVVCNSSILKEKFKKEVLDKKSIDSKQISKEKEKLEQTIKGIDIQLEITYDSISVNEVNHMLKKIDEKRYKGISSVLEEELTNIEDRKKTLIQEIDDLDNQKEWVDWISKYGDDISKRFEKPTSELLEGIVDKIIVSPVMGETREGKETQRGHIFNIKFKLPIVYDSIEYKNDKKKSDGYSLKDGKKSIKTGELKVNYGNRWNHDYVDGNSKKKSENIGFHTKSFNGNGFS